MSDSLLAFIWSRRRHLIIICILAAICSTIVAYLIPVRYKASTILFSSLDNNIGKSLLSDEPYPKDYLSFGEEKNCEQLMQIFKSGEVMRAMDKKFNLMHYYGIPANSPEKYATYKDYFYDNFSFEITEYQSIKVDVSDKNKDTAAVFANGVVEVADSLYRQIIKQRTQPALKIVKQQYDSTSKMLTTLEDSMTVLRKVGVLDYETQVKELTKGYADATVKGTPSSIQTMDDKLKLFGQYGKQYWSLYYGLFHGYKWMQQLKINYAQAKANAEKYVSPFFIAEKAVAPDKKSYPIRWLVVAGSTFAALFFGLLALLIMHKASELNSKA
jgi:hypothetical protein